MRRVAFWLLSLPVTYYLIQTGSLWIFNKLTSSVGNLSAGFSLAYKDVKLTRRGVLFEDFSLADKGKKLLEVKSLCVGIPWSFSLKDGFIDVVSLASSLQKEGSSFFFGRGMMSGALGELFSKISFSFQKLDLLVGPVSSFNSTGAGKILGPRGFLRLKGHGRSTVPVFSEDGNLTLQFYFFSGFTRGRASFQILGSEGRSALVGNLFYVNDDWNFNLKRISLWGDNSFMTVKGDISLLFAKGGIFLNGVVSYPGLRLGFNGKGYPFPSELSYRFVSSALKGKGKFRLFSGGRWSSVVRIIPSWEPLSGRHVLSLQGKGYGFDGAFSFAFNRFPFGVKGKFSGNFTKVSIIPELLSFGNNAVAFPRDKAPVFDLLISRDIYLVSKYASLIVRGGEVEFSSPFLSFTYSKVGNTHRIEFSDWTSSSGYAMVEGGNKVLFSYSGDNFTVSSHEDKLLINGTSIEGVVRKGRGRVNFDLFPLPFLGGFLSGNVDISGWRVSRGVLNFDSWLIDGLSALMAFKSCSGGYEFQKLRVVSGKGKITGRGKFSFSHGDLSLKFSRFLPWTKLKYTGPYLNGFLKVKYSNNARRWLVASNLFTHGMSTWQELIEMRNDTVELSGPISGVLSGKYVSIKGPGLRFGGSNGFYRLKIEDASVEGLLNSPFLSVEDAKLNGEGIWSEQGTFLNLSLSVPTMHPRAVSITSLNANLTYEDGSYLVGFRGEGEGELYGALEASGKSVNAQGVAYSSRINIKDFYQGYVNGTFSYSGNGEREISMDVSLYQGEINYKFLSLEDLASALLKNVFRISRFQEAGRRSKNNFAYRGVIRFLDGVAYNRDGIYLDIKPGSCVRIENEDGKELYFGRVEFEGGNLDLITTDFTVEKGYLEFLGDRIAVDLTMKTQVESNNVNYEIVMRVYGYADDMRIELSSSPYLPREKIVALLGFSTDVGTIVRKLFDRTLVGKVKSDIENRIAGSLGLRRVSLSLRRGVLIPSSVEDIQLSLEKSFGPNMHLYYSLGFEERGRLYLRHTVSMRWNLGFASLELNLRGDSLENMSQEIIMVKRIEF